jgi:hypothetical protein
MRSAGRIPVLVAYVVGAGVLPMVTPAVSRWLSGGATRPR